MGSSTHVAATKSPGPATRLGLARRTSFLLFVLLLLAVAWPLSRRYLLRPAPAPPPTGGDLRTRLSYYVDRIKANPLDTEAYVRIGELNEERGFYMAAVERLRTARALGAPDAVTAGPLGRSWLRLARYDEARQELERAVRAKPDSAAAAFDLASFFAESADDQTARQPLQFFARRHPSLLLQPTSADRDAVERLMVGFALCGDEATAIRLAEQFIGIAPGEPNGYAVAGRSLLTLGRYAEAAARLRKAVELAPQLAELRFQLAAALQQLPGQTDAALHELDRTVVLNPRATGAYLQLGNAYAKRKEWTRAGIAYMFAGATSDDNPHPFTLGAKMWSRAGQKWEATFCRARAASLLRNHAEALRQYQLLLRHPDPVWRRNAVEGVMTSYNRLGRAEEALAFILRNAKGHSAEDYMRIADAYGELREYGKRKLYLQKALAKDPKLKAHVHHQLGAIFEASGKRDEAEREYESAAAADPNNATYSRELAEIYLERRNLSDRLQRAVRSAERTVQLSPNNAEDQVQLGLAYSAAGDLPRAIQTFQHAIDLEPGYGPTYLELGRAYRRAGDAARSTEMLQLYRKFQAFDLEKQNLRSQALANAHDPARWEKLADFFAAAHDYRQATQFYERAAQLAPESQQLRRKLLRMYDRSAAIAAPLGRPMKQAAQADRDQP